MPRAAAALLSPATIAICLGLSFCNYLLRGLRWVVLGRAFGVAAPAGRQLLYFFAGFALTVTPGKVGEVVRLWLLNRHHGVPYTRSMPLLAGDRVMDMVAICLLALAGAALTSQYIAVTAVLALVCIALLAALTHAGLLLRLVDWTERRVRRAPGLFARAREVCATLPAIGRPAVLWPALGLSVLGWLAECLVLMLVLHALGTAMGLGGSMLVFCLSAVAGAVSLMPGGLGGRFQPARPAAAGRCAGGGGDRHHHPGPAGDLVVRGGLGLPDPALRAAPARRLGPIAGGRARLAGLTWPICRGAPPAGLQGSWHPAASPTRRAKRRPVAGPTLSPDRQAGCRGGNPAKGNVVHAAPRGEKARRQCRTKFVSCSWTS